MEGRWGWDCNRATVSSPIQESLKKKKKKKSQKVAIYAFCSELGRKHKQLKKMKIVALWAAGNRVGGIRGLLFFFVRFVWFDLYNCVGVLFFMESIDHV